MDEFIMKTDGIDLDQGQIWATQRRGIFRVLKTEPSKWTGEDIDVYAHVQIWLICRPATDGEIELWNEALSASAAMKNLRSGLGIGSDWLLNGNEMVPPSHETIKLDSYDDRWEPPRAVKLNNEQIEIVNRYAAAYDAINFPKQIYVK